MTSWRDSASPQTQADLDGLLNVVMPFAERMLAEVGAFYPFGAAVAADGELRMLGGDPSLGEHPEPAAVIASMYDAVRGADDLRAVALAADVKVGDADAVRVDLEHVDGVALAALFPYVVAALDDEDDDTDPVGPADEGTEDADGQPVSGVVFGEAVAVPADHRIWV